jgi:ABC-type transport system involved in cytochrome c biogenesis permease subunit
MTPSAGLLLSALLVYGLGVLGFSAGRITAPVTDRIGRVAVSLTVLGFVLHGAGLAARVVEAGRAPLGNMYEFAVSSAFAATAAFLVIGWRTGHTRQLGMLAMLPVLVTLTVALMLLYDEPGALVPALRSAWLNVHVTAAAIAVGAVTVGTVGCAVQLAGLRRGRTESVARADTVTRLCYAVAFPVWTFAVTTGAIWAQYAWGRYWGWDPKEVWAFVTWVVLAAYLHARQTAGVRRRTTAVVGIVAYGTLVFNFVGVNIWFGGLHSYAGL